MVDFRWADPMDAYDKATQRTNAMFDTAVQAKAGQAFAAGDFDGAAGILAKTGKLDQAAGVRSYADEREDRTRKRADDDARRRGTAALATRDYTGASTAFAAAGDADAVVGAQNAAITQFKAKREFGQKAVPVLRTVLQRGGAPAFGQAVDSLVGDMRQLGFSDDEINATQTAAKADPEAFLSSLALGAEKKYDIRSAGDTLYLFDMDDPKTPVGRFEGTKFVAVGPGDKIYQVGGGNGSAAPEGPSAAPGAGSGVGAGPLPAPTPSVAAPGGGQPSPKRADPNLPRGLRNNNPLNVRPLAQGSWSGQSGVDGGNYAVFESPEAGWKAADTNLRAYGSRYGINTIAGVINRWAPASDGNTPSAYVDAVSKATGIGATDQIDLADPATRERLLEAMAAVELGRPYRRPGASPGAPGAAAAPTGARPAPQPAAAAGGSPGARLVVDGGPKPTARQLSPQEVASRGFRPGTVAFMAPDGDVTVKQSPNQGENPQRLTRALRTEFEAKPDVKAFRDVSASFEQVRRLATKPNAGPADDIALTFSFMKMLDPGSVVREGEYALVGRAAGLDDQIVMALQQIDNGKGLTPELRRRLVSAAETVYQGRRSTYDELVGQYRSYAEADGLDPDRVVQVRPAPQVSRGTGGGSAYSDAQRAYERANPGKGQPGSATKPYYIRPQAADQSFNNIPKGAYFVAPDGSLRRKP